MREFSVGRGTVRLAIAAALAAVLAPVAIGVTAAKVVGGRAPRSSADPPMSAGMVPPIAAHGQLRRPLGHGLAGPGLRLAASLRLQPEERPETCAAGMALVQGSYCPVIHQRCLRFADPEGSALYSQRCAEFETPTRCLSPQRQRLRFCIDLDERKEPGGTLPKTQLTAAEARESCEKAGKRLCTEKEWTFACEGEGLSPYPYGATRDSTRCNSDQSDLVAPDGSLVDRRAPAGSHPDCKSAFNVRDLTGNVEEYVVLDSDPGRYVRKGAYWQPGANTCRTRQSHPDPGYQGIELGFRCCSDAPRVDASPAGT